MAKVIKQNEGYLCVPISTIKDWITRLDMVEWDLNRKISVKDDIEKLLEKHTIKSVCEYMFSMIRRDQKTQKAYCFICKKEIEE